MKKVLKSLLCASIIGIFLLPNCSAFFIGSDKYTKEEYAKAGITWEHHKIRLDNYYFNGKTTDQLSAEKITKIYNKNKKTIEKNDKTFYTDIIELAINAQQSISQKTMDNFYSKHKETFEKFDKNFYLDVIVLAANILKNTFQKYYKGKNNPAYRQIENYYNLVQKTISYDLTLSIKSSTPYPKAKKFYEKHKETIDKIDEKFYHTIINFMFDVLKTEIITNPIKKNLESLYNNYEETIKNIDSKFYTDLAVFSIDLFNDLLIEQINIKDAAKLTMDFFWENKKNIFKNIWNNLKL